jgi:hypothetical protein
MKMAMWCYVPNPHLKSVCVAIYLNSNLAKSLEMIFTTEVNDLGSMKFNFRCGKENLKSALTEECTP